MPTTSSVVVVISLSLAAACAPSSPPPAATAVDVTVPASAAPPSAPPSSAPGVDAYDVRPELVGLVAEVTDRDSGRVAVTSSFSVGHAGGAAIAELVWVDGVGRFELAADAGYVELGLAPRLALPTRLAGIEVGVELRGATLDAARRRVAAAMTYLVTGVPMVEESPGRWRGFPPGTGGFVAVTVRTGPAGLEQLALGVAEPGASGSELWIVGSPPGRP